MREKSETNRNGEMQRQSGREECERKDRKVGQTKTERSRDRDGETERKRHKSKTKGEAEREKV